MVKSLSDSEGTEVELPAGPSEPDSFSLALEWKNSDDEANEDAVVVEETDALACM